jgi:hypothetical protein
MKLHSYVTSICLGICMASQAQQGDSAVDKILNFPNRLFARVQSKTADLNKKLEKQTEKYLKKLIREEDLLKKKLYQNDSAKYSQLFAANPSGQYQSLVQKIKTDSLALNSSASSEYLPYLDSLHGSLSFLKINPQLIGNSDLLGTNIQQSLSQVTQIQAKLQDADEIKQFIEERKAQIKQWIMTAANLPPGVQRIYQDYNQELYYYNEQVKEYKDMLNDPDKMFETALVLLNKLPAFTDFIKNNSILATLFRVPGNYGTVNGLVGLETRDQAMAMIQNQVGAGGPNAAATMDQNMASAQDQLSQLKERLTSLGSGNGSIDMADFKPNAEKTKTFLKRLEYGLDIQTLQATNFYPTTSDIGLSLGYKLKGGNSIGIGASYKIGWGTDIHHISISNQGVGLRSFVNIQMKKNLYMTGGLEYNYQQPFSNYQQIHNLSDWQQSGLIGITKSITMNTKFIKKTNVQVLWDFLSYYQVPRTQPFKFRVGYGF